jgi:hypothetical protein
MCRLLPPAARVLPLSFAKPYLKRRFRQLHACRRARLGFIEEKTVENAVVAVDLTDEVTGASAKDKKGGKDEKPGKNEKPSKHAGDDFDLSDISID